MSEKRYLTQFGKVIDVKTGDILDVYLTSNLLNAQSAEIAELRETVEVFKQWAKSLPGVVEMEQRVKAETGHDIHAHDPRSSYMFACRRLKALGVEVPDAAKGG